MAANTLNAKLVAIQAGLKAPKSQYNEFGKYKYRKAEDILEAVKPLLAEQGCSLTCTDELLLIGDRYYIKATATITDGTASVSTSAFAREELDKKGMDQSQVTGASSSYARKYALNGLLCIDDTQDSDTTNVGQAPEKKPATKKGVSGVSPVSQPIQPEQPKQQKPASKLAALDPAKRAVWVEKVARREKTKDGVPAMTAFLKAYNPTAQELNEFNDEVFNYALTHSNEIDNPGEFQH